MSIITCLSLADDTKLLSDRVSTLRIRPWKNECLVLADEGTHYGFVWQGEASLNRSRQRSPLPLQSGMYFSLAEAGTISGAASAGFIVTHLNHRGQFLLGGPVGPIGRLAYIDGGTTSLLVPPLTAGDPCLNALYMPANVNQTVHTHPSDRVGLITRGYGNCAAIDHGTTTAKYALQSGTLFYISARQQHRFCTGTKGLDLVVFHPDSDLGMSDRNHPMLRRTLVKGTSAADLPKIQTQLPSP